MSSRDEQYALWKLRWDSTFDSEDPLLSVLSDEDILAVCDGYDDYKIDTVFQAYVDLRRQLNEAIRQRWITGIG